MIEELKPCPFCGSRAELYVFRQSEHTVRCRSCYADCGAWQDHYRAVAVWNHRPAEDRLKAEVERLKSGLEYVCSGCKRHTTFEDMLDIAIWGEKSRACDDCYVKKAQNKARGKE